MVRHVAGEGSRPRWRPSAVSQALRAIRLDDAPLPPAPPPSSADYRLRVAYDAATRERAYRLAYRVYRTSGFADPHPDEHCVNAYDTRPDTFVMLAEDAAGRAAATVTLVFDAGAQGLPCDEIFAEELAPLRRDARRLAEVTRLAMAPEQAGGKTLLLHLFSAIFVFARRVRRFDDFVIEVNPRHAPFYQRLLGFEPLGPERPCPRVKGAPALLLRLDLQRFDERVQNLESTAGESTRNRDLKLNFALARTAQTEVWLAQTLIAKQPAAPGAGQK